MGQVGLTSAMTPTAAVVTANRALRGQGAFRRPSASLSLINIGTGATSSVAVAGITGVAVAGRSVYVARNAGSPLRGEVGLIRGATVVAVATGLPPVGRLGLAEGGAVLLATHASGSRLSVIRPATGAVQTVSASTVPGAVIEVHGLADGRLAILSTDALVLIDDLADLGDVPVIDPPAAPLFVGSWAEISFDLGNSGLGKDDVRFEVPDGPDAGFVSYTRVDGVGDPVPLLVVGGLVGKHKLVLVATATGTELATAEFEITDHWADEDTGPAGFYATDFVL